MNLRIFIPLLFLGIFLGLARGAEPHRVLMLFVNARMNSGNQQVDEGFRSALDPEGNQSEVTIFPEFLDVSRFPGPEQAQQMEEYLLERYRNRPPDVLVVLGGGALEFWFGRRDRFFPGTPVVFGQVAAEKLRSFAGVSGVTGVPLGRSAAPAVEAMLALRPQTRQIVLVHGSANADPSWREDALRQCAPFTNRVEITAFPGLPLEELKTRLTALPGDAAVICLTYPPGSKGSKNTPTRVVEEIAAASAVPVMGLDETYLGTGVLGSVCSTLEDEGVAVGRLTRRVLSGERPQSIGILPPNPARLIVDERQLKRWGIKSLPAEAEVRFHTPTLWEEHRGDVLIALGIMAVQAVLILLLLASRRRARETGANLSLAADSGNVGLWQLATGREEFKASPKLRSLFGLRPSGRIPVEDVFDRIHPDDRSKTEKVIQNAANDGRDFSIEHRMVLPDVGVRWIASTGRAEVSRDGRPARVRGVSIDITEIKQAEMERQSLRTELAHVSRVFTMGQLSTALAHELNQPLAAILSNAEAAEMILEAESPALDQVREILADIRRDDERAGEVIRRMRAFLRKRTLETQRLDVNELVRSVLEFVKADASLRGTVIHPELLPDPLPARGDRVHLQQVLLNLIVNGMDATVGLPPSERRIRVRTGRNTAGEIEVAVSDNGQGIPPDRLPHLFDSFFTTKPDGLGMGVSIAHTIIQAHQGRIWAENNPAGGATFRFTLPEAGDQEPDENPHTHHKE